MSKNHKYLKAKPPMDRKQKIAIVALSAAILVVLLLIILLLGMMGKEEPAPTEPTEVTETTAATEETTEATEAVPEETEPEMLPHMKELYEKNPDVIGWIRIDGTKLDYPVMHTPDEKWKYDHLSFDGKYDYGGVPYLKEACSVDPPTDNLIIYGHNMTNGSQFHAIMYYQQKNFWEQHPRIYFSTLYEEREYEVMATFFDRVYKKAETCFKYYEFIDPETKEEFDAGIDHFKNHCLYETGVRAEWGDQLLTLVTCAYHVENGRFVVVARLVDDEPAQEAETTAD